MTAAMTFAMWAVGCLAVMASILILVVIVVLWRQR